MISQTLQDKQTDGHKQTLLKKYYFCYTVTAQVVVILFFDLT